MEEGQCLIKIGLSIVSPGDRRRWAKMEVTTTRDKEQAIFTHVVLESMQNICLAMLLW